MAKIFISYSRADADFAHRLAGALSDEGADVWIDVEAIPAGMKWSSAIQEGLQQCDAMIVVISPHSMSSVNVEDEWQYYLDKHKVVIPVRLHPADVHFQLSRIQYVDFCKQPFDAAFDQLLHELARKSVFVGTRVKLDEPIHRPVITPPPEAPAPVSAPVYAPVAAPAGVAPAVAPPTSAPAAAPAAPVFWEGRGIVGWLLPPERFGLKGRLFRILVAGLAFGAAYWLLFGYIAQQPQSLESRNLMLHSLAILDRTVQESTLIYVNEEAVQIALFVAVLLAVGFGLTALSTGIARRRDLPLWQRIVFPLLLGSIPWAVIFVFLSQSSSTVIDPRYFRPATITRVVLMTLSWQLALILPAALFRFRLLRLVFTAAGLTIAFFPIFGFRLDNPVSVNNAVILPIGTFSRLATFALMGSVISAGIWLADWLMPQTGRTARRKLIQKTVYAWSSLLLTR